ncbi:sensor histidine kinase [Nocardia seriolae]|uniref:histidine kinase n=1 Tax=Nocardia seriolae TaxID=37332 RepID=A0ABC9YR65_9NOCA|nr:histidine kinase [Nocardia seriolae]OJF80822.1 sensor histidine kinase [Nocardia seriolae]QOW35228.1 two-component sensor histidine kinase [Nocardia seriolae]QUN17306.1 two-component sensor histidine kinase [Nocardia seriolae]WNJ62514.1 histidine kinase [Nocardia seriolae]BEK96151.1 sensor histidine kinase [Nocardia seriolae]
MRRFSLWLRGKPLITDSVLALVLASIDVLAVGNSSYQATYLVFSALLPLPIVFRRTHTRAAALAIVALSISASMVHAGVGDTAVHPALLGRGIMLYTLVAYVGRRQGLIYLGILILDSLISAAAIGKPSGTDIAFTALYYALCWTMAEFVGARHAYDAEVAARLAVADYDRERRAHDAVAAERTRIARELHDVVAHAVSVIIVQADGARYALRHDPGAAEQALPTIAGTGRDALRELRRTVELLRTEHAPEQLPQHGTAGIAKVVDMMRSAGLDVSLQLSGELDTVTPEISLGIHRIVQESLTNTLRHAGPDPHAEVGVTRRDTDVVVEIIDSGALTPAIVLTPGSACAHGSAGSATKLGLASTTDAPAPSRIPGSGLGLVGMRERIAVLGGTLSAGRNPHGGWTVRATIPLDRTGGE